MTIIFFFSFLVFHPNFGFAAVFELDEKLKRGRECVKKPKIINISLPDVHFIPDGRYEISELSMPRKYFEKEDSVRPRPPPSPTVDSSIFFAFGIFFFFFQFCHGVFADFVRRQFDDQRADFRARQTEQDGLPRRGVRDRVARLRRPSDLQGGKPAAPAPKVHVAAEARRNSGRKCRNVRRRGRVPVHTEHVAVAHTV